MDSPQIAKFMGPTWGPSGADRTQVGPMLAPWTMNFAIWDYFRISVTETHFGSLFWNFSLLSLQQSCEHHGVSNHQQLECLFNSMFRLTTRKTSIPCTTGICEQLEILRWPADSPHKGPVMWKAFPSHQRTANMSRRACVVIKQIQSNHCVVMMS